MPKITELHINGRTLRVDGAYCTSGMIMSGVALLQRDPNLSEAEIVRGMEGNICRCGAYPRIIAAVKRAATVMRGGSQ